MTSEFFAGNRAKLKKLLGGKAPIVLGPNGLVQSGGDMSYPFAQDASFWYFTGVDEPDIVLVMDGDEEYIIAPVRDAIRSVFDGALDEDELENLSGVSEILDERSGWQRLGTRLKKSKQVMTLAALPNYIEHLGMYANPARSRLADKLESYNDTLELIDISPQVVKLRSVKQPAEVAAIQKAIDITAAGLMDTLQPDKLSEYEYEYEIEAGLTYGFRRRGALGHGFDPIVAGGHRACTLHNTANSAKLAAGELVLCDVGADYKHYAADITRTVATSEPTKRQMAVHAAVNEAREFAISLLKPGVLLKSYEQQVEQFMGEKLRELGLIKTISRKAVRQFYPHATSHFLGLNAHDVGDYSQPLQPGIVLTVEPGIYIPKEALGVRIEDDVLITAEGNQVLSGALPHGWHLQ